MIKINKDLKDLPSSLYIALGIQGERIPRVCKKTNQRRDELITKGCYIDKDEYNRRYKMPDIKEQLLKIYHHKCAYCEQRYEPLQVEHYRPKSHYYWLAYSWDNLVLACSSCNNSKGASFDIAGTRIDAPTNHSIHNSGVSYNKSEKPKLVNPECEEIEKLLIFDKNGGIASKNERVKYTISKQGCNLDRPFLQDSRKEVLADLEDLIEKVVLDFDNKAEQIQHLRYSIDKFIKDAFDSKKTFLAFRRFAVKNLLSDLI